ncbi:MAG: prepilin-type N-terminal cleavage/methylation domain-containing protein [Planctomycetes bacterium]|nr:prepilin-type N-terminal cleavage/methylation domain-containing protein [Planctomycetota bacterium]
MRVNRLPKGFTLLELMHVISIIAILISILFPSMNGFRAKAKISRCANNQRWATHACLMYAQENINYLPPLMSPKPAAFVDKTKIFNVNAGNYAGMNLTYDGKYGTTVETDFTWADMVYHSGYGGLDLFQCPTDIGQRNMKLAPKEISYGLNWHLYAQKKNGWGGCAENNAIGGDASFGSAWQKGSSGWGYYGPVLTEITSPVGTILMGDREPGTHNRPAITWNWFRAGDMNVNRHMMKDETPQVIAFCDGHVEVTTLEELWNIPPEVSYNKTTLGSVMSACGWTGVGWQWQGAADGYDGVAEVMPYWAGYSRTTTGFFYNATIWNASGYPYPWMLNP